MRNLRQSQHLKHSPSPNRGRSPSRSRNLHNSSNARMYWNAPTLRRGVENYYGLVSARHDWLGNRDQLSLLIEDAQPRRLPFARIEFGGSTLSRDGLPGLNLREREIEFRAMANAFFDDGQHGGAGQFRKQIFERNRALHQAPRFGVFFKFRKAHGLVQREFAYGGADDFGKMRAGAMKFAELMRERANISSGTAFDHESRERSFDAGQAKLEDFHFDGLEFYGLMLSRELMRGAPVNFFRGEGWRSLHGLAEKLRGMGVQRFGIEFGRGIRAERLAIGVVGIGRESETDRAGISFSPAGIKAREARGASQGQDQHAGGERVERAEVTYSAEAHESPHGFDYVVRSLPGRLVDDENSVEWRRL